MAIKLKVDDSNTAKLEVSAPDAATFKAEAGIPIYPSPYTRTYTVTPSNEEQVLETAGLMMTANVRVEPIPSNYGLITWNGSTLTVS